MTKIRKDEIGLYVQIEGWICRPKDYNSTYSGYFQGIKCIKHGGTHFKEGDEVRGSHPAGQVAHLRVGKKGTSSYNMEKWNVIDLVPRYK